MQDRSLSAVPALTPPQLKKALVAHGFEIFRTLPEEIVLAERPRENLILDSGVRVGTIDAGFRVRVVLRAQQADFPHEKEAELFARVRNLAIPALEDGFVEQSTQVNSVKDPADAERTLDTFYELFLAREVATLDEAMPLVKFALALEKAVATGR